MSYLVDVSALSERLCQYPIQCQLAYATPNNFLGRIVAGYHAEANDICLMTPKAAKALCDVQNNLITEHQLGLLVYDAYRPKRAVQDFLHWSTMPPASEFELIRKNEHFPHIEKNQLFSLGYVAEDSNHCYGNTVDLVLFDLKTKKPLDMGAIFDFMDVQSHLAVTAKDIGETAYQNRMILQTHMKKCGFEPYIYEFWHFCHGGRAGAEVTEPLDIEITPALRGINVMK